MLLRFSAFVFARYHRQDRLGTAQIFTQLPQNTGIGRFLQRRQRVRAGWRQMMLGSPRSASRCFLPFKMIDI